MLNGRNNEEKIWNYLKGAGLNDCGAAGLMGNLYAESGLRPDNLQNTYEKKLGMTDASYTAAVDGGTYTGFVRVWAGTVDLLEPETGTFQFFQGGGPEHRRPGDAA